MNKAIYSKHQYQGVKIEIFTSSYIFEILFNTEIHYEK